MLWVNWQICTIIGVFIGSALPDSLPLDFAVPLVFLVLLVPAITSRPSAVAAIVGGGVALLAAEAGASQLSVLFGALAGIVGAAPSPARATLAIDDPRRPGSHRERPSERTRLRPPDPRRWIARDAADR